MFPDQECYACIWKETKRKLDSCLQSRSDLEERVQMLEEQKWRTKRSQKQQDVGFHLSFQGLYMSGAL